MTEQAVAQTDGQPEAGAEDTGEQDLDAILNEYSDEEPKERSEEQPETDQDTAETLAFLRQREEQRIRQETDADIQSAVQVVKGDLPIDEDVISNFVYGRIVRDQRLVNAWQKRHDEPAKFQSVLGGLHKELADKFSSLPDKELTENREAMRAAVNGQTETPASEVDFDKMINDMSEAEFRAWRRKQA